MKRLGILTLLILSLALMGGKESEGSSYLCEVKIKNPSSGIKQVLSSITSWAKPVFPDKKGIVRIRAPKGVVVQVKVLNRRGQWSCHDDDFPILVNEVELTVCHEFYTLKTYDFTVDESCSVVEEK